MESIDSAALGIETHKEDRAECCISTTSESQYTPQPTISPKLRQYSPTRIKSHKYVKHSSVGSGSDYCSASSQLLAVDKETQSLETTRIRSLRGDTGVLEKYEDSSKFERVQAIFRKYNLEIDEAEWNKHPKVHAERVHKPTRMRVRWTCHECKACFGHDKICAVCAHMRCRKCTRYPVRKKKSRKDDTGHLSKSQEHEVRSAACHECQTVFEIGALECATCHHTICDRCLEEIVYQAEQAAATPSGTVSTHITTDKQ